MSNRHKFTVTAILRSYGRPLRTKRMLDCLNNQVFNGFELLFMGDGCPHFSALVKSDWFKEWKQSFEAKKNKVHYFNQASPHNDWGAHVLYIGAKIAIGKYLLILDNDDMILPEHIDFYYHSIERLQNQTPAPDFVYNPTIVWNGGNKWVRQPELRHGGIGHQELIIKTEFFKKMPKEPATYEQDWWMVQEMLQNGHGAKGNTPFPTHQIMSIKDKPEPGFENDN